jgi:hypothetical protein
MFEMGTAASYLLDRLMHRVPHVVAYANRPDYSTYLLIYNSNPDKSGRPCARPVTKLFRGVVPVMPDYILLLTNLPAERNVAAKKASIYVPIDHDSNTPLYLLPRRDQTNSTFCVLGPTGVFSCAPHIVLKIRRLSPRARQVSRKLLGHCHYPFLPSRIRDCCDRGAVLIAGNGKELKEGGANRIRRFGR